MPKKQREGYAGCSIDVLGGRLRLRFRLTEPNGRRYQIARATGYEDTTENREKLEALRRVIGSLVRAGRDPRPHLDAIIARPALHAPARVDEEKAHAVATLRTYFNAWLDGRRPLVRRAQLRDYRRHIENYVLRADRRSPARRAAPDRHPRPPGRASFSRVGEDRAQHPDRQFARDAPHG
jgi:hypothetical protein